MRIILEPEDIEEIQRAHRKSKKDYKEIEHIELSELDTTIKYRDGTEITTQSKPLHACNKTEEKP